ncbi:MAG: glycosyltransferase family 2 protein [bacterium]
MFKKVAILVSPNWQDYAKKYLPECIASIRAQHLDNESKIFLIDNETNEESFNYLKITVPEAEIVRNKNNDGFAKAYNDSIKLALEQGYDYLFLINIDTVIEPDCIAQLIKQIETDQEVAAVQARLMLWSDKNKINSIGNVTHFLGFGYCDGYKEEYKQIEYKEICYPSGAGVLFKADALKKVGLFDEEMWMYNEDQDLGWRLWLAGYKCILAPKAVVYHKYSFSKSIQKYYWMERNRIINIIKNYHLLTILLIFPAWIIMELGLCLFALEKGWFDEKIRVYKYFFKESTCKYLKKARKESQSLRKVPDHEIVKMFSGQILYQEIDSIFLRIANVFFDFYWQIVKLLIIW